MHLILSADAALDIYRIAPPEGRRLVNAFSAPCAVLLVMPDNL